MRCWVEARCVGWVDRVRERKKWGELERFLRFLMVTLFLFRIYFYHAHIQLQLELYDQAVVEYLYRPFFNSIFDKRIDALLALDDLTLNPIVVLCSNLVEPYRVRRVVLLDADDERRWWWVVVVVVDGRRKSPPTSSMTCHFSLPLLRRRSLNHSFIYAPVQV